MVQTEKRPEDRLVQALRRLEQALEKKFAELSRFRALRADHDRLCAEHQQLRAELEALRGDHCAVDEIIAREKAKAEAIQAELDRVHEETAQAIAAYEAQVSRLKTSLSDLRAHQGPEDWPKVRAQMLRHLDASIDALEQALLMDEAA
jgi:uncharacterized coiled-coil DUF342 family protein